MALSGKKLYESSTDQDDSFMISSGKQAHSQSVKVDESSNSRMALSSALKIEPSNFSSNGIDINDEASGKHDSYYNPRRTISP